MSYGVKYLNSIFLSEPKMIHILKFCEISLCPDQKFNLIFVKCSF